MILILHCETYLKFLIVWIMTVILRVVRVEIGGQSGTESDPFARILLVSLSTTFRILRNHSVT